MPQHRPAECVMTADTDSLCSSASCRSRCMRSSAGEGACGVGCRELSSAEAAAAGNEGGLQCKGERECAA